MPATAVDVEWIDLDAATPDLEYWYAMLDDAERAAGRQFRFERDRRRFVVRRGWLRALLAERLDMAPREIRFSRNRFGKPSLPQRELAFNLSHSAGKALCAVAGDRELGCDLEWRDPSLASPDLAERFFSPAERHCLAALPGDQWLAAFFNCWTRKEAYIKARGMGLSYPLDRFDVSLAPGEPARLMRGCTGWSVEAFEPASGFTAAVVAAGDDWHCRAPLSLCR